MSYRHSPSLSMAETESLMFNSDRDLSSFPPRHRVEAPPHTRPTPAPAAGLKRTRRNFLPAPARPSGDTDSVIQKKVLASCDKFLANLNQFPQTAGRMLEEELMKNSSETVTQDMNAVKEMIDMVVKGKEEEVNKFRKLCDNLQTQHKSLLTLLTVRMREQEETEKKLRGLEVLLKKQSKIIEKLKISLDGKKSEKVTKEELWAEVGGERSEKKTLILGGIESFTPQLLELSCSDDEEDTEELQFSSDFDSEDDQENSFALIEE